MTDLEFDQPAQINQTLPLKSLYSKLLRIRRIEEMIGTRYLENKMRCPTHLSIGQEYGPVCLSEFILPGDQCVSTHRAHAHYLSMGGDLKRMIAEIYGKSSGCSGGRGGSMHLIDEDVGFMGSTAIVGNSIPLGVGLAWAKKIGRQAGVVIIFLGDAAIEEGAFYEASNFALIHKLPVLFFCENNLYSVYSPLTVRQPNSRSIYQLASGMGFESHVCNGYDIKEAYDRIGTAVNNLRQYQQPQFIEIKTYRYKDHCGVQDDSHLGYRSLEEVNLWKKKDPLLSLRSNIERECYDASPWLEALELQIENEITKAFNEVEAEPDLLPTKQPACFSPSIPTPDFPIRDTLSNENSPLEELSYANAINLALHEVMQTDQSVICYGLGINDPKRIFGTTNGLFERFGDRVMDMPTAENGMLGIGIGGAINSLKPVMVHQRFDFFLLAMDQLVNNAAKWFFTFGEKRSIPICIRLIIGRGWGQGPTHSQALVSWLSHIPGLKVVMPSSAEDAKGLLISSILDPNPVIFIEHRWCHQLTSLLPKNQPYRIPIGKAKRITKGTDITLISVSYPIIECISACKVLAKTHNINIDLIDLRSISPIDWPCITSSVRKTNRLLVVDPGWGPMGIGSEIIAHCAQHVSIEWKSRPKCISLPHSAIPTGFEQTKNTYLNAPEIATCIVNMMKLEKPIELKHFKLSHPHDIPNPNFTGPF